MRKRQKDLICNIHYTEHMETKLGANHENMPI